MDLKIKECIFTPLHIAGMGRSLRIKVQTKLCLQRVYDSVNVIGSHFEYHLSNTVLFSRWQILVTKLNIRNFFTIKGKYISR